VLQAEFSLTQVLDAAPATSRNEPPSSDLTHQNHDH